MALALIFLLYISVGILAAGGAIALTANRFTPRAEQVAYGLLLTPIAAIYLVFLAYFSPAASWGAELYPILAFALLGLAGTRTVPLLMLGYFAHGAWDLAHEYLMLQDRLGSLTAIPLAYGIFCAAFDWAMVVYFWTRAPTWAAARRGP